MDHFNLAGSESNTSITSLEWLGIKNSFTGSHWAHITGLSELHPTGFLCLIATLIIGIVHLTRGPKPTVLPVVNPPGTFELTANRVKKEWLVDARQIIRRGFEKFPGKPFNMIAADVGLTTVLPPEYASEIRNNPSLSFVAFMAHLFFSELPGFEPTREGMFDNDIGITVVHKYLTVNLARITEPLSREATAALKDIFTDNSEWHDANLKAINLALVARLSSRIFLGEELCRNEEWLKITVNYTVDVMKAAERLRRVPGPLRRIVHWFLPEAQKCRDEVKRAGKVIRPVLEKRRREKATMESEGKEALQYNDAIEWFEQMAKSQGTSYDPEVVQLFLSTVAIHTTSDLLTVVMADLARNPEIIEPLREEISSVLRDGGWKKTSLTDMKLLDSVLKESLRLKPIAVVSMRRVAMDHLKLSDGTFLPKGTKMAVSSHRMWDPDVYENPEQWDGFRYVNLRETPGRDKHALFVSTSERHLGFGHGKHACPGRFFASSELKVALCHILMKYDFELAPGTVVQHRYSGASYYADPAIRVMLRRRNVALPSWFER
ncbi:cytochrome P450 monooxygenase [Aspergillus flavus]|uniref:Cytochrome P450 n=2 Tax=Aspergillus subgen. Circumdati TaxID=2720871 RepID=A0A1S9DCT0_ASPOZ|nr:cytochrome P450 [Aspergillus oryzae]RAQ59863.1 cytochrome P450 monooxygenase [Aspergillus flavus]RAQ68683.1 cytochrome P450 monooxygenase [Aspergillus flavus]RMZ37220.1 cytochrome P450 monooxygenase [Aspergillus flavus]